MKILLIGANGMIGRYTRAALEILGHEVIGFVRRPSRAADIVGDFSKMTNPQVWLPHLKGIDVVINAIGVLRDTTKTPMLSIHYQAPKALFEACEQMQIAKVIQVSALGVDTTSPTLYQSSKLKADLFLQNSALNWTILRPSVVFAPDGASAKMFLFLSKLPIVSLPGKGQMRLQPVHIQDLVAVILASIENKPATVKKIINCVGSKVVTYKAMLASYALQQGKGVPLFIPIPLFLMRLTAKISALHPDIPLEPDTLKMLLEGSFASTAGMNEVLGHDPISIDNFLATSAKL